MPHCSLFPLVLALLSLFFFAAVLFKACAHPSLALTYVSSSFSSHPQAVTQHAGTLC